MKKIKDWFDQHQGRLIIKHSNYLDVYERYLSKFRGKTITILEFYHITILQKIITLKPPNI